MMKQMFAALVLGAGLLAFTAPASAAVHHKGHHHKAHHKAHHHKAGHHHHVAPKHAP
jgi:uncharacterized low-complexity protein